MSDSGNGSGHTGSSPIVLVAALANSPVASRMAMRLADAGCVVAAVYPSKAHPLAVTAAVSDHRVFSVASPGESLAAAIASSGAAAVLPCDGMVVRHLHALHSSLSGTAQGAEVSRTIERSLGDPTAYLLLDSRHEVQTAARAEGVRAAESFAIGRTTGAAALAETLTFPWRLRADYAWDGRDTRLAGDLREARAFIRRAGSPPGVARVLKGLLVDSDRAALEEWLHAMRPLISAQRPVFGRAAATLAACHRGRLVATMQTEILSEQDGGGPPAQIRLIENAEMRETAALMANRLGLSGFHEFCFELEGEPDRAWLTGVNAHCALPAHLNAGPGRDLADSWCRLALGFVPQRQVAAHEGEMIANFPQAWIVDAADPILNTGAYDAPLGEPMLTKRLEEQARRSRQYRALRARLPGAAAAGHKQSAERSRDAGEPK